MESEDEPPITQSIGLFYNLLTHNGQHLNSSNAVFDSGGRSIQSNDSQRNITNNESGLRLIAMVCPITVIFVLAVTGNILVIATLAINRRMRTAFNAFLLNLAVADLLLGIFCMPFTLSGFIMKQFIFGPVMCKLIPYLQEILSEYRYYAICQPLKSKSYRQSSAHVYKVIGGVWLLSLILMSPIAYLSELQPTAEHGKYKCRENWPSSTYLIVFTIFLDIILFVIPLFIMIISYFLIALQFLSLGKQTVMHPNDNDGQASYDVTTRQSSIDATYADGDTFLGGTQSQTNYSMNYQDKTDSMIRNSPVISCNSQMHLDPTNGHLNNQLSTNKIRQRSTSPNSHELLSAKSSTSKLKTISFSGSLENISIDDKDIALSTDHQLATPTQSVFTNDDHSPVFKRLSVHSAGGKMVGNQNSRMNGKHEGRSFIMSDRSSYHHQLSFRFSLRKKDKNNNQERVRKPSSSTISSNGAHGLSSNENSIFLSNIDSQQQPNYKLDSITCHRSGLNTASTSSKDQTAMKLRSSVDGRLAQKRQSRVIKMLAILVFEFFICWLPLHCINLIALYKPTIVYDTIGYNGLTIFLMLAYMSSCTNPITYFFINSKFRQSFLLLFSCCRKDVKTNQLKQFKPKIKSTTIEDL